MFADKSTAGGLFIRGSEPLTMVGQFTHLSGKPALPPKWAFGPWMSSNNWDSQKRSETGGANG